MEDKIIDQVRENTADIKLLKPKVELHDKTLYGDRSNRKDEGLVGTMNNIEEFVTSAKSWIKWMAMTVMGAAILGGLKMIVDMVILVRTTAP